MRPLTAVKEVERLAIVGPEECLSPDLRSAVWRIVPFGHSMVENLEPRPDGTGARGKVLVVTADIPLITAEAIEDFLVRCRAREADVYYPVVAGSRLNPGSPGSSALMRPCARAPLPGETSSCWPRRSSSATWP